MMEIGDRIDGTRRLMARQLRVRGDTIAEVADRAGRKVPRRIREDVRFMAEAEAMGTHPKMARRINPKNLARAEQRIQKRLGKFDPAAERRGAILDRIALVAFILVVTVLVVFFVMLSRGAFEV